MQDCIKGVSDRQVSGRIAEFLWRERFGDHALYNFWLHVSEQHQRVPRQFLPPGVCFYKNFNVFYFSLWSHVKCIPQAVQLQNFLETTIKKKKLIFDDP